MKSTRAARSRLAVPTFSDLLAERDLRTEQLSVTSGVSPSTIYRAKRGKVPVRGLLYAMAHALGIEPAALRDSILASAAAAKGAR